MHLLHMGSDSPFSSCSRWLGEYPTGTTPGSVSMVRMCEVTDSSEIVRNANVCRKKCAEKPLHGSSSAKTTTVERGHGGSGEWLCVCVRESVRARECVRSRQRLPPLGRAP